MAIVGRDLDPSERKVAFQWSSQFGGQSLPPGAGAIQTGQTFVMFMVPFPCTVQSGSIYAIGVSTAMQVKLTALRWAAGSTSIDIGISNMALTSFGTSGVQGFSGLAPAGSTLLNLLTNDVILMTSAVSNGAAATVVMELVVKKTQDIVSYQGVST